MIVGWLVPLVVLVVPAVHCHELVVTVSLVGVLVVEAASWMFVAGGGWSSGLVGGMMAVDGHCHCFLRFCLFIHERHRERGRDTAEGEAGSPQGA